MSQTTGASFELEIIGEEEAKIEKNFNNTQWKTWKCEGVEPMSEVERTTTKDVVSSSVLKI